MATRFYPSTTDAAPVSPAYSAAWEETSQAARRLMATGPPNATGVASVDVSDVNGSNGTKDTLHSQLVSAPLTAQTITGTVYAANYNSRLTGTSNLSLMLVVKVVSGDGATVRGVLVAGAVGSTGEVAGSAPRYIPSAGATTVSSVAAQEGDRLVVELGFRSLTSSANQTTLRQRYGYGAGTNIVDTAAAGSTNQRGWVLFSQDLTFQPPTVTGASALSASGSLLASAQDPIAGAAALSAQASLVAAAAEPIAGGAGFSGLATLVGVGRVILPSYARQLARAREQGVGVPTRVKKELARALTPPGSTFR